MPEFSDLSARLSLPYLLPAQAQKHVTHNEALRRLDLLVQLVVQGFDADLPPDAALGGQIWALADAPSGAWEGKGGQLAAWLDGGWQFLAPQPGWLATRAGSAEIRVFCDGLWQAPARDNLPALGVNASAGTENRLVVASAASLFTHEGTDHRMKINKSAPPDTASLLFQSGWSGRAEFGLTGDDDFRLKVSADGSSWQEALRVSRSSGALFHGSYGLLSRGDVLGIAAFTGGLPSGALFDYSTSADGQCLRLTDGTQLCWHRLALGSPVAAGAGSFADPWRSLSADWTFPAAFLAAPVISAMAGSAASAAADRMLAVATGSPSATELPGVMVYRNSAGTGSASCFADLLALGRWA